MEITLNEDSLNEVRHLRSIFIEKMQNETTSMAALIYCLNALLEAEENLEKKLNEVKEGEENEGSK